MIRNKYGQVWIETVLYTIVGLAIIGIVLGFVMPKINQSRDNIIVEQSIKAMKELDAKIKDVSKQQGNIGKVELSIKRGYLDINASNNSIYLVIDDLSFLYSEANVTINDGDVKIKTVKGQKVNSVYLTLYYDSDITYAGQNLNKKITAASLPYNIYIENKGNGQIDITGG